MVVCQGDGEIKYVGVVWLGAGPAQPGAVLGDICDLDVVHLCCNSESEDALSKDMERKALKERCLSAAGTAFYSAANESVVVKPP